MQHLPKKVTIYTDGSASTHAPKAGAFCAVIIFDDTEKHIISGSAFPTSIGKMELTAINAALNFVLDQLYQTRTGYTVEILSDSTYVVGCASGQSKRSKNLAEWALFDFLVRGMDARISHVSRNTVVDQAECDELAGLMRQSAETTFATYKMSKIRIPNKPLPKACA